VRGELYTREMPVREFSAAVCCRQAVGSPPVLSRNLRARDSCPVPLGVAGISHAAWTDLPADAAGAS